MSPEPNTTNGIDLGQLLDQPDEDPIEETEVQEQNKPAKLTWGERFVLFFQDKWYEARALLAGYESAGLEFTATKAYRTRTTSNIQFLLDDRRDIDAWLTVYTPKGPIARKIRSWPIGKEVLAIHFRKKARNQRQLASGIKPGDTQYEIVEAIFSESEPDIYVFNYIQKKFDEIKADLREVKAQHNQGNDITDRRTELYKRLAGLVDDHSLGEKPADSELKPLELGLDGAASILSKRRFDFLFDYIERFCHTEPGGPPPLELRLTNFYVGSGGVSLNMGPVPRQKYDIELSRYEGRKLAAMVAKEKGP